jgi:hypothetical protein
MSLLYYSRIRFTQNLLPELQAENEPAHVISVYGAGLEGKLFRDDLALRHHYSFANARSHIVHMTTIAFERLSRENPNPSLVHVYPGLVVTPAYKDPSLPLWFRAVWVLAGPLVRNVMSVPPEEAAKRMLFLASARFAPLNSGGVNDSAIALGTNRSVGVDAMLWVKIATLSNSRKATMGCEMKASRRLCGATPKTLLLVSILENGFRDECEETCSSVLS